MSDLGIYLNSSSNITPENSTSRANNTQLSFTDMLNLMVVQLQNQTMDDTADTSQMLSQMIQMQVVQSITDITDATVMTYASSLVGKEVTVGTYDSQGNLEERVVTITGTGYSNGSQVLFAGDEIISLTDIMAVGRLPEIEAADPGTGSGDKPGTNPPVEGTDKPDGGKDTSVEDTDKTETPPEGTDKTEEGKVPGDRPTEGTDDSKDSNGGSVKDDDVVDPAEAAEQAT